MIGNDFDTQCRAYLLEVGFSKEFAAIATQLVAQDIYYLRLHDDGYDVEGLPLLD